MIDKISSNKNYSNGKMMTCRRNDMKRKEKKFEK